MDAYERTDRNESQRALQRIRAASATVGRQPTAARPTSIIERAPVESSLFASRDMTLSPHETRSGAMGQVSEPVN